jgi:uncharacterized protein YqeY
MIKDQLNTLILNAMKSSDKVRVETLRAIKTAFMNWETAKENVGKTLDDATEISIIRKLVAQYEDTAKQCNDGKHDELVAQALATVSILNEYLPKPATEEEITQTFLWIREGAGDAEPLEPIKKNMGVFIKRIKEMLPNADGKLVSQVVMKHLN